MYNPMHHNPMGGKVNLYLDDESLKIWNSLPTGIRSQVVRESLMAQLGGDPDAREKLLIQEKRRRLFMIQKDMMMLKEKENRINMELKELESRILEDEIEIPEWTNLSPRFSQANRFWNQMVAEASNETPFVKGFKPSKIMAMYRKTGHPGLQMYFVIRKNHARVEMYIYSGKNRVDETQMLYDYFIQHKENIELNFGQSLIWQDTSDTARRIIHRIDGIDIWDESTWHNAKQAMTDSMEMLWRSLQPYVDELRGHNKAKMEE
jgi:hypothetical protein